MTAVLVAFWNLLDRRRFLVSMLFERPARNLYNRKVVRDCIRCLCLSLPQLTSCPDEGTHRN